MDTKKIQHKEVINLIQVTIQMKNALKEFLIKIEEEEQENQYILVNKAAALEEIIENNKLNMNLYVILVKFHQSS
jgi:hypothetical protein